MSGLEVLCNVDMTQRLGCENGWTPQDTRLRRPSPPLPLLTWLATRARDTPLQDWVTRGYTQVRPGVEEQS